jgi:hypothetical protein
VGSASQRLAVTVASRRLTLLVFGTLITIYIMLLLRRLGLKGNFLRPFWMMEAETGVKAPEGSEKKTLAI